MRSSYLIAVFGFGLSTSIAAERAEFLSPDQSHALEVQWQSKTNAQVRVYRRSGGTGEANLWTTAVETPPMAQYHLKGSLSNNGELAMIEPRDAFNGPALLFFRNGTLVRAYAGGYIAAQITDERDHYEKDLLSQGHVSGLISEFDNPADPKLFRFWLGATDRWFGIDLRTGDLVKPSKEEEMEWNRAEREKCLGFLKEFWEDKSSRMRRSGDSVFASYYRFLTCRHIPGDEGWIRRLLTAEIHGGGYSGRQFGVDGPVFTGVTKLMLSGGSQLRNLGDMLLAKWEGRWEPGREESGEWAYPGDASYVFLSELHARVELPRAPGTNDGSLRMIFRATEQEGTAAPIEFAWEMKTAIEIMRHDFARGINRVEPLSNKIDVDLSALPPGTYSIETLWTRTRIGFRTNITEIPGDYFERNHSISLKAGEKGQVVIQCTNQLPGHKDLYAADLAGWTNIEEHLQLDNPPKQNEGRTLAEQALTNVTLGPLTLRKLSYGTQHEYLSHKDETVGNCLQLWFDYPKNLEPLLFYCENGGAREV